MFNINLYFDPVELQIPLENDTTENTSEGLSENISTEINTSDPDSISDNSYDYQYSDIEFLMRFNEETSEYDTTIIDNRPYMSAEVNNATLNDIYTMSLSIRNIVLLWFSLWMILKFKTMIHNAVMKYMEGRK